MKRFSALVIALLVGFAFVTTGFAQDKAQPAPEKAVVPDRSAAPATVAPEKAATEKKAPKKTSKKKTTKKKTTKTKAKKPAAAPAAPTGSAKPAEPTKP
jgi:hypothetical protein